MRHAPALFALCAPDVESDAALLPLYAAERAML